jgi:hypothetical protein
MGDGTVLAERRDKENDNDNPERPRTDTARNGCTIGAPFKDSDIGTLPNIGSKRNRDD